jgi:hypothetical protein
VGADKGQTKLGRVAQIHCGIIGLVNWDEGPPTLGTDKQALSLTCQNFPRGLLQDVLALQALTTSKSGPNDFCVSKSL